jgi:hypothetical protein
MAKPNAPDPAIGIWKLNIGKSTFKLTPAPKGYLLKNEAWEDGLKSSVDIIDDHGNRRRPEVAFKFDGMDYPLKDSPLADTISAKRINERTTEIVWKKGGKAALTSRNVISADGKTFTVARTGKDTHGGTIEDTLVLERQ